MNGGAAHISPSSAKTRPAAYRWVFALVVPVLFLLSLHWESKRVSDRRDIIWSDSEGYYMYLPAIFIYGGFEHVPIKTEAQFTQYPGTNKVFTKYTCGLAIMQAPFFLAAHAYSKLAGLPADGYTGVYAWSIILAALIYSMLGLELLRRELNRYFPLFLSALAVVGIYLGTNLFYYSTLAPGMSHAYSFFWFCVVVWLTPRFLSNLNWKNSILLALALSFIVLIRPTNAMLALYVLLYQVYSWAALKERVIFLFSDFKKLLVFPVVALLVFLPQLIYWKYTSGSFIINSYSQTDAGFIFWNEPKIVEVLTDVQNGWLLYSPLMVFALFGVFIGLFQKKVSAPALLLILAIATYSFASWWAWWFGAAFGHRCYIEFYALLAFPLAYFMQLVYQSRVGFWLVYVPVFVLFCFYSVGLANIYNNGPWDGPNWNWGTYREKVISIF